MMPLGRAPEKIDICAPVAGGIRWHRHYHDVIEFARRHPGYDVHDPENPKDPDEEPNPAPEQAHLAPRITSTPPAEARVGETYVYQASAFCGYASAFTWYFEQAAPGMTVDRHTGLVTWTPSEGGYVDVVLSARSLYGATARHSWTILVHKALPVSRHIVNQRFRAALMRKRERTAHPAHIVWRHPGAARRLPAVFQPAAPPDRLPALVFPLRI